MCKIHPLAYVDPKAELGRDVTVGPFALVGPGVMLGDGCTLHPRATLLGPASFGAQNVFFSGCVLGSAPQDLKYKGGPTRLEVGDCNQFREHVTVHRGTEVDQASTGVTRIGNRNLIMVGAHIAHDSIIGDHVIIANAVLVAGHVSIEDCVNIGGGTAMHHFVTIGRNAYVGGMTRITHDVPPYMKVLGYDAAVRAVNSEGMRRWRIPDESVAAVKQAFRLLYARRGETSPGRTAEALREIEGSGLMHDPHVAYLARFLRRKLDVGIYGRAREHGRADTDEDRNRFYGGDKATTDE